MASLLRHWLNDELHLRRRVDVLERDLSNGVGVAEVLHALGLEPQLELYEDSDDVGAKMRNLERLAPRLEAAGIAFPLQTRRAVLMEDRAAVLQLVLQLKALAQARSQSKQTATATAQSSKTATRSRVYDDAARTKTTELQKPRDVDERFVVETAQRLQPTALAFRKDVDMAVHLRRFEQAQYTAENAQAKAHEQRKAADAADNSAGAHATRTHLNEKRAFMKQWDSEHHDKWKESQRRLMMLEHDDLRLELTLAERARIREQRHLDKIQHDASTGVTDFEHNLIRLGLGDGSTTPASSDEHLRAIPTNDTDARAHFATLEQRVEQLAFRPSNNVKMMKELRARRKAQLAAEKDRRMRRRQPSSNGSIDTVGGDAASDLAELMDTDSAMSSTLDSSEIETASSHSDSVALGDAATPRDVRDKYLESKRAELEANYDRLRATGSERREAEQQALLAIRAERHRKTNAHKWNVCVDATDALIDFAYDVAILRGGAERAVDVDALKQSLFLVVKPQQRNKLQGDHSVTSVSDDSNAFEIDMLTCEFLAHTGMWHSYFPASELPIALPAVRLMQRVASAPSVRTFVQGLLAPPFSEAATTTLDTTWKPCSSRFIIVCVISDDSAGDALAQRIARERGLQYVTPELIIDECVQLSVDASSKPGDAAASSSSDRERELSALGAKVAALRQKNAVLSESLVVEVVVKFISFMPRGNDSDTEPPGDIEAVRPTTSDALGAEQPTANGVVAAPVSTSAVATTDSSLGCLLHNFPRSHEEAKLLERALISAIADDETRTLTLAAFERSLSPAQPSATTDNDDGDSAESVYVSQVEAVAVIAALAIAAPLEAASDPVMSPSVSITELHASSSKPELATQESKRVSVTDAKKNQEIQARIEHEAELLRLRLEARAQLEAFWHRTARVVALDPNGLHVDVAAELLHLSIDVLVDDSAREAPLSLACSDAFVSEQVLAAREQRRSEMEPLTRARWLCAANEVVVSDESLREVLDTLDDMDRALRNDLSARFAVVPAALHAMSMISVQTRADLDALLDDANELQHVLGAAAARLQTATTNRDRLLTELEVALGDTVDATRRRANAFIDTLAQKPTPAALVAVDALVRALASMCFVLKEHTIAVIELLQHRIFDVFYFLNDAQRGVVALARSIPQTAIDAAHALQATDAQVRDAAVDDVTRILRNIATEWTIHHSDDNDDANALAAGESNSVHERSVVACEVQRLLQRIAALCAFTSALQRSASVLDASDTAQLRCAIVADAKTKNAAIDNVVNAIRQCGQATWPLERSLPLAMLTPQALRMPRCVRAQFLSPAQLQAIVDVCRTHEQTAVDAKRMRQDAFVALLLACAQRSSDRFPSAWTDAAAVARAVRASGCRSVDDNDIAWICWRSFVFALLSVQFIRVASDCDLERMAQQAALQAISADNDDDALHDVRLPRDAFDHLPLWRKVHPNANANDDALHALVWKLLQSPPGSSNNSSDANGDSTIALSSLLLLRSRSPQYSVPTVARDELQSFLPAYARGLARAFASLATVTAMRQARSATTRVVNARHVRVLLSFASLHVDDAHFAALDRTSDSDAAPVQWDVNDVDALAALLAQCEALTPELAQSFVLVNPLDALLRGGL